MARCALLFISVVVCLSRANGVAAQCGGAGMTLTDGDGFTWDVTGTGGVSNGTGDAFDCGLELSVDGTRFPGSALTTELAGRQIVVGPATMGSLEVTRRIYVPETQGWARVLEHISNPGSTTVTASIHLESNLGSDSGTTVTATSSGDTTFTTTDRWVATDDGSDGSGDPSMSHNYWGAGALSPDAVGMTVFSSAGTEGTTATFDVTIPASSTAIVMYFVSQNMSRAEAMATATTLDALPAEALVGISAADAAGIVNWSTGGGAMDLPNGASCVAPSQCISGFCVDGRCCNRACNLACEVCSVAAGAISDGSCVAPVSCTMTDGGPPGFDAGIRDAGRRDAGRTDAGTTEPPRRRDRGCCSVAGANEEPPVPLVLLFSIVVVARLRRASGR